MGPPQLAVHLFPRSRRAFAVARLCHGARTAVCPRPDITAIADCRSAAAFSIAMRRYSAGEQVPCAIIRLRRAIVSHDAIISSAITSGSGRERRDVSFFMVQGTNSAKPCAVKRELPANVAPLR